MGACWNPAGRREPRVVHTAPSGRPTCVQELGALACGQHQVALPFMRATQVEAPRELEEDVAHSRRAAARMSGGPSDRGTAWTTIGDQGPSWLHPPCLAPRRTVSPSGRCSAWPGAAPCGPQHQAPPPPQPSGGRKGSRGCCVPSPHCARRRWAPLLFSAPS